MYSHAVAKGHNRSSAHISPSVCFAPFDSPVLIPVAVTSDLCLEGIFRKEPVKESTRERPVICSTRSGKLIKNYSRTPELLDTNKLQLWEPERKQDEDVPLCGLTRN